MGVIHLREIIRDLGILLMAAAVLTLISKMLRQPAVLGYLIAGFFGESAWSVFPHRTR
jgi:CPA2 family monovalent cation:H+ antiporter-2